MLTSHNFRTRDNTQIVIKAKLNSCHIMSTEKRDLSKIKVESDENNTNFQVAAWGYRHQQCFILFLCLTVAYSMRTCIGVSLVAMTEHNDSENDNNNTVDKATINLKTTEPAEQDEHIAKGVLNALMLKPPYPKFSWNKKTQDAVISSFFWGYMLTQIPAGHLAHKFGAKYLLTGAMMINCIVSILLPFAAYYGGWVLMVICRILQGLSQACVMPGMHTLFGKWAPLHERGRITAFTYGGSALGTVLGLPITGFIASSSLGWPGIFRFYGLLSGIIGGVLWWLIADSPAKHPKITEGEKRYIEDGLGQKYNKQKKMKVPWLKILSCPGMYAIIAAHIGNTWTTLTLFSEIPAFMDKVMKLNIKANGLLTALPFLVMWIANFLFCWVSDIIIVKKLLNVTNTRKVFNSIGSIPPAIGLIVLAFAPKTVAVVETILIIICSLNAASHSGFQVNHIDISPNFAGIMMSLSNFAANSTASLAPIIAGAILTDVTNEHLWRQVFFVSAGFYFISNLIYMIFGTGVLAEWNESKEEIEKDIKEDEPMIEEDKNLVV